MDWLIRYFRETMAQTKIIIRKPTVFQHFGLKSSFDLSHDNTLKDRFFDTGQKHWQGDDPPGKVITTMKGFGQFTSELAYASGSGYFWAEKPQLGDTIQVLFEEPQHLEGIGIQTGNVAHPSDYLEAGTVEVSGKILSDRGTVATCADPILLGNFTSGQFEQHRLMLPKPVQCLTITVTRPQEHWIVFNQIAIFVKS